MTGGGRPLYVAGVAGGVGTSTWVRILQGSSGVPVEDRGRYLDHVVEDRGRFLNTAVDILVTDNSASAASRIGDALRVCPRKPVLVVMHRAVGEIAEARPFLRQAEPHLSAVFSIAHRREWLGQVTAPGSSLPRKAKDVADVLEKLWPALHAMYSEPLRPSAAAPAPGVTPAAQPARQSTSWPQPAVPRAGPHPGQRWPPQQGGGPPHALHRGRQGG